MTHKPDDDKRSTVKNLSAIGMSQESIATILGITAKTLIKHYRDEYENGNAFMLSELVPISLDVAKDPDHKDSASERRFLLERKGGFVKTENLNHGGKIAQEITKIEITVPKLDKDGNAID